MGVAPLCPQREPEISLFLLLVLCAGEPLVQQLLAIVDLPGMHLHSNDDHQVHDRNGREAEDEAVGFAVPIELLRHREHLHGAVDQRGDADKPCTDHGDNQVADVVAGQCQEAEDCRDDAEQVRVLPLVGRGHHLVGHQAQLAYCHLRMKRQQSELVQNKLFEGLSVSKACSV